MIIMKRIILESIQSDHFQVVKKLNSKLKSNMMNRC